jgi:hypothetical protein
MTSEFTLEFVTIYCEIICVIARKASFGSAKQRVFELLLTWVSIPKCVHLLERCLSVFFESETRGALQFPSNAAILHLLVHEVHEVQVLARQTFSHINIPLPFFETVLKSNTTDELLSCIREHILSGVPSEDAESFASCVWDLLMSAHGPLMGAYLSFLWQMLIRGLLTDVMRETMSQWISDKFLTVSLDPEDYCAFPIAAEFLARQVMDLKFLLPKLVGLHDARIPFCMCAIESDDCAPRAVGKVGLKNLCSTSSFLRSSHFAPSSSVCRRRATSTKS